MNRKYIIKGSEKNHEFTNIGHIGIVKHSGDEWSVFTKKIDLASLPDFAAIRFDSMGVCGAYVNGEFIAANTGRYANRITYAECTSKMKLGENEIKLVLGGHYYQPVTEQMRQRRKSHFSAVAAELEMSFGNVTQLIPTDTDWLCESDDGQTTPEVFSHVTGGEYDRFWLSAALWKEEKEIIAPDAVCEVAGGYKNYVSTPKQYYAYPSEIVYTNMEQTDEGLVSLEEKSHVMYSFDKVYCGYIVLECDAEEDGEVEIRFDYTGYIEDIETDHPQRNLNALRLTLKKPLKKGENKLFFLHRRAPAAFMKVLFNTKVTLKSIKLQLDMLNHDKIGYFNCSEQVFNDMWEVGKYTLHITKHQEYESCPKNEMKYFTGDGIIAALIDAYVFGDGDVTLSSLALTEIMSNSGRISDAFMKNIGLSEYPAWRIVHAYNHYVYFNDRHLVEQYFDELATNIDWYIGKMNKNYLFYQYPIFIGAFARDNSSTDYTQSPDRLGEKPLVNALFYKSLVCMAEFADVVGDARAEEWRELAKKVKKAINDKLWCEEKSAYLDTFDTSYIPQDGNALCLLYGIAEGDRATKVMNTLRERLWTPFGSSIIDMPNPYQYGGNDVISPPMNSHEAEGRFLNGDEEGALELMRRCWGSMMKNGAKTFWEYAPAADIPKSKSYSSCHGWSAGCTYLLSAYVLGIRPEKVGYETVRFEPCRALDRFEGVVPTLKGLIAVNCKTEDGKKIYTLAIPKNTNLITKLPENSVLDIVEY